MDSSQAKEKIVPQGEGETKAADPFASDIFAVARPEENFTPEIAPKIEIEKPKALIRRLPKAARPAVDWNELRRNLPTDFSADLPRMLAESLAKYLNFGAGNPIEFLFLIERETNEIGAANNNSWWLNVSIEASAAEFAVEIDDVFAAWLIDAMVGERRTDNTLIREFTPSEIAVLEFLAVNLTHEANKIINAPLFKFSGLSRKNPVWTNKTNYSENFLLVSKWQTVHGFLNSIVKIYVTPETLNALNTGENTLLTAAPRRNIMWNSLKNRVADVRARLFLGESQMTLADAAGLETGDVILPEKHNFSIAGGELAGGAEIFLGDGKQVKIFGSFVSSEFRLPAAFVETDNNDNEILLRRIKSNRVLQIAVERFDESNAPQLLEKSMSNEAVETTENAAANHDGEGIALENLAVTLRVELEARRLSLAEVAGLRINQIIELGVSAADPVNLLIDEKVVARGELVEVEDRLGVRIVQILR